MPTSANLSNPLMDAIINKAPTSVAPALRQALTSLSFSPVAGLGVPEAPLANVAGKLISPEGHAMPSEYFNTPKPQSPSPTFDYVTQLLQKLGGKGK